MKKLLYGWCILLCLYQPVLFAQDDEDIFQRQITFAEANNKIDTALSMLEDMLHSADGGVPGNLIRQAQAMVIIPDMIKLGFVIGGKGGLGLVMVNYGNGRWSNPSFVSIAGGSVGWQIGAQSTDLLLIFRSRLAILHYLKDGKFTLGADLSVTAGPLGRGAQVATDGKTDVYAYTRSSGLFAGIALEGAAIDVDAVANQAFYRRPVTANQIFYGNVSTRASNVARLKQLLGSYTY